MARCSATVAYSRAPLGLVKGEEATLIPGNAMFALMENDKDMQPGRQCACVNQVPSLRHINYELGLIALGFAEVNSFGLDAI